MWYGPKRNHEIWEHGVTLTPSHMPEAAQSFRPVLQADIMELQRQEAQRSIQDEDIGEVIDYVFDATTRLILLERNQTNNTTC